MKFIVFEGLDGAGKSTLIEGLRARLHALGRVVHVSREPGGTELGEKLRHFLLAREGEAPTARAELLLYQAIRAQHVELVLKPALNAGKWVLCDRYTASSLAFQAGGRGLNRAAVDELNRFATNGLVPDLTVLLDLPSAAAKQRMAGRELDRFEIEQAEFHERVRQDYLRQAEESKSHWLVLDANLSSKDLLQQLLATLEAKQWLT